ncbi:MAG TPA: hypothetical protein PLO41_01495, partial [Rubrivivax sp.]|nr:hypothetical protein [Rubrivivax sp.]
MPDIDPGLLPGDEERQLLRDSLRGWLQQRWPAAGAVERSADSAAVTVLWSGLVQQGLGALGSDPIEGGLREALVAMEELGRAAAPAPLAGALLANLLLSRLGAQHELLAPLHRGEMRLAVALGVDRRIQGGGVLGLVDEAELQHAPEHVAAPALGLHRVGDRIDLGRRLGQAGDHGDLREVQLVQRDAVVDLRRCADAVGPVAEEDLVQVELENLILGQLALNDVGEHHFLQLALVGLLGRQEKVARHLHGDGAAALLLFMGVGEFQHGAQHRQPVDARVLIEAIVFGGDDRLLEQGRHLLDGHRRAPLLTEFGNQAPVVGEHLERRLQPHLAQRLDRGEL